MASKPFLSNIEPKIGTFSAWFVACAGFLSLVNLLTGFHRHFDVFLDGYALGYVPAILIFLAGLSFLTLIYDRKFFLHKVFSIPILIASILGFFEIFFDVNLGVDRIFAESLSKQPEEISKILVGGVINNFLTAFVFLFWPTKKRTATKSAFLMLCLFLIIIIALEGWAIFLFPLDLKDLFIWMPVHPAMAVSQIILALGLMAWNLHLDANSNLKAIKWFAPFFGFGVLVFHFFLINGLIYEKKVSQEDALRTKSLAIQTELRSELLSMGDVLHNYCQQSEQRKSLITEDLVKQADSYLKIHPSIISVAWLDKNFKTTKITSKNGGINLQSIIPQFTNEIKERSSDLKIHAYFNSFNTRLIFLCPINWDNQFQGCVLFEIDAFIILEKIQSFEFNQGYFFNVFCSDRPIFKKETTQAKQDLLTLRSDFDVYDLKFYIMMSAPLNLLINRLVEFLIVILSLGGIIGGVLTGLIIFLVQSLREKVNFAQKFSKRVEMSDGIMRVMNEADTINEACDKILQVLNRHYGWDLFLYWQYNQKKKNLELVRISTIPFGTYAFFEKNIREIQSFDGTLFQESFDRREVVWSENFSESKYKLASFAKHEGIKGAFALPVFQNRQVLGVVELFQKESFTFEQEYGWIEIMKTIGNEFSFFIERREAHLIDKELTTVVRASSDAIYKVDLNLTVQSWNLGAEIIYGWKAEEIIGCKVEVIYPLDRMDEIKSLENSLLQLKSIEHFKTQRKRKDGSLIWVENSYSPIVSEENKILSFSVVSRDITKEKLFLDALALNEEKFRLFVDSTKSWIWEMDLSGNYTYSNQATIYLIGFDPKELIGKHWLSLAIEKEKLQKEWNQAQKELVGWKERVWQVRAKNGSLVWLESSAAPIYDRDTKIVGLRGFERDVTDEIVIDRTKNEFISMINHELRTPLTSIIGALGLLKNNNAIISDSKELILLADRNAERLLRLINDIIDLEKINLGKMELKLKLQDLSKVVKEAVEMAQVKANEGKIEIVFEKIAPDVFVEIDYDRIVQVLLNLFSNSIKFSNQDSSIEVEMSVKGDTVRVSVQDHGLGIPYDIQGKIFEKFVQGQTGNTKVQGTGLGLNISKELIERMKGKIGFFSEPGKGALFFFDLPIVTKKG